MSDEETVTDATPASALSPSRAPSSSPDEAIVASLRSGDRERTATLLVDEHALAVGRACMALLGSQSEAEDALQETLVAALNGLEQFRGDGTLRAWLLGIARRRCARRLETLTREQKLRQSSSPAEPQASAERLSLARRARRLLDDVRPTEREALVLRFAAELSFREVGEACGIDEAAARKRVSRGLARLRALLGEDKT